MFGMDMKDLIILWLISFVWIFSTIMILDALRSYTAKNPEVTKIYIGKME